MISKDVAISQYFLTFLRTIIYIFVNAFWNIILNILKVCIGHFFVDNVILIYVTGESLMIALISHFGLLLTCTLFYFYVFLVAEGDLDFVMFQPDW